MSRPKRPLNLEDIAALAGVSRSTVSRVINKDKYVGEKTRKKVLSIVEKKQFSPHPGARMLMSQRAQAIGIVFLLSPDELFEDPQYFPLLLQGVHETTNARDYATLLWLGTQEDEVLFQKRILQNRLMDGLVIASTDGDDPLITELIKRKTPFVMLERPAMYASDINCVIVDNVKASKQAVQHLLGLGHKRIATITGKLSHIDGKDRFEGYQQALKEFGLKPDKNLIQEGDFSFRSGFEGMKVLLKENQSIDAVFAATDRCAMGVLSSLQQAGFKVPEDIAVVGFDDLPDPLMQSYVPLTTVRHHVAKRAALATELLIDLVEGRKEGVHHMILPTEVVIRKSCGS